MSSVQNILKAFEQLTLAQTTLNIKQAQSNLLTLSNQKEFISSIKTILQAPQILDQYKKVVSVYTIKHARHTISKKDQNSLNFLCEQLMKIIQSKIINLEYRKHVTHAIQTIIASDRQKVIKKSLWPLFIKSIVQSSTVTDQNLHFDYLAQLGQILLSVPNFLDENMDFMQKSFVQVTKLTIRIQKKVQQAIQLHNLDIGYQRLQTLRLYSYLMRMYMRRFLLLDPVIIKLLYSDDVQPMISKSLSLNLPNNSFSSSIYIVGTGKIVYLVNRIKSDFILVLSSVIRMLTINTKQSGLLNINSTFCQSLNYLPILINATSNFISKINLEQLTNQSAVKTLEKILGLMSITIKNNNYYQIFTSNKTTIIEDILFKLLMFNKKDIDNYRNDPEQFLNSLMHIIDKQVKPSHKKNKNAMIMQNQQEQIDEEIESQTLKTLAAELLLHFSKYQDGTLSQIFKFCEMVMEGQLNTLNPKSLFLLIVVILRQCTQQRTDLVAKLYLNITKSFQKAQLPIKNSNQLVSIEYSMYLIVLLKYFEQFFKLDDNVYDSSFKLVNLLLTEQQIDEVPLLISFNIIDKLSKLPHQQQLQQNYSLKILLVLNKLLVMKQNSPSDKMLDCLYSLIKYNDEELAKNTQLVVETVMILSKIVQIQVDSNSSQKVITNKCWNIIRQVGQSNEFVPLLIPQIQEAILPLLVYLDTKLMDIDFEEDFMLLMTSFIEKSKQVTKNQLRIFEYIPKIFYQRYHLTFGNCSSVLHTFIFYGKQILSNAAPAINSIIDMCKSSIAAVSTQEKEFTQADNCQGLLLMQSLILSVGPVFNINIWKQLMTTLTQRLQNQMIEFDFFRSNIVATMSLILLGAHRLLQAQLNEYILGKIVQSINSFHDAYSCKIVVMALSELLVSESSVMNNKFSLILDIATTILQKSLSKKDDLFQDKQYEQKNEEKDYKICLELVTNSIKNIDQFQYFKSKINWLKEKSHPLLYKAVNELPLSRKEFLKNVLVFERIMNEPRQIYKVKRQ